MSHNRSNLAHSIRGDNPRDNQQNQQQAQNPQQVHVRRGHGLIQFYGQFGYCNNTSRPVLGRFGAFNYTIQDEDVPSSSENKHSKPVT